MPKLNLNWKETLLRALADYAIVQGASLASLIFLMLWRRGANPLDDLKGLMDLFAAYYTLTFLPLSLIFPVSYALFGLYTYARTYSPAFKWRLAARAAATATLLFLFANFVVTRNAEVPRSAAVVFGALVVAGTVGARWFKHRLLYAEVRDLKPSFETVAVMEPGQPARPVLVVGGAGYIGSMLVGKLLEDGYNVRVLDRLVYGDSAIRHLLDHPRLEFIEGDCRNIQDVVAAMSGVKSVVHLAAIVGDPACDRDHQTALEINYAATRMMIQIAKGYGVERFVFASSCSVYGASDYVMDENSKTQPISLYAQTKVDSERELLEAADERFHPVVLRFATIFGLSPRPRFDLVVNLLTAKAIQEGVITVFNGEQWRPFLHVGDAARAVQEMLECDVDLVSGQVFNVGDDRLNYTLTQIASLIGTEFPGTVVDHVENSDKRNYRVSFDRISERLGFHCTRTIEDGILEIRQAFESGRITDYRDAYYSNVKFLAEYGSPATRDELGSRMMAALAERPR